MDIYDLLRRDHDKVAWLLDRLVACSESGNDEWKSIVDMLRKELIPHSRAEEAVFYNAIREKSPKARGIAQAFGEHAAAEVELRALQAMKAIDVNWTRMAKRLRDNLNYHVEVEESEIFETARKVISDEQAIEIGRAFEQLKPKIESEGILSTTADLVGNMLRREPPRSGVDNHI